MPRRVLFLQTRRDQIHRFEDAAMRLGAQLIPFDAVTGANAAAPFARAEAIDACVAADGRAAVAASIVAASLGLPWHSPSAVEVARNKLLTRERLRDTDLLVPWFFPTSITTAPRPLAALAAFPCVIKPLVSSGGRGVVRADDIGAFVAAFEELRTLLGSEEFRVEANEDRTTALVEGYIDGWEFALVGVMQHGSLNALALFDKPDPIEGPRFEDTLYVTPSLAPEPMQWDILDAVSRAAATTGLRHGPIHAECRVDDKGVYVLGVTPRPLDAGWSQALRFQKEGSGQRISYEELLLRHALGEATDKWRREPEASGARRLPSGFVCATGETSDEVERSLRSAVIESGHG